MKTTQLSATLAVAIALLLITLLPPVWAEQADGFFQVSVKTKHGWRSAGRLTFDKDLREQYVRLGRLAATDPVRLRLTHRGDTAAHIDAIRLDDAVAETVAGALEESAVEKLAAADLDVADASGRTLELTFDRPRGQPLLALTARIEPRRLSKTPFRFPAENLRKPMSTASAFYEYELGSRPGSLATDGELAGEALGDPFFVEFCKAGSGHPSTYAYGWVKDDGAALYVAIDLAGDNTMDGDEDYAAVYAVTPSGLRRFEQSVPRQEWGKPGFSYTDAVAYQHKVYEFRIPLAELGLDGNGGERTVQLAFEAYGTLAPQPAVPVGGETRPLLAGAPAWLRPTLAGVATALILATSWALVRRRREPELKD